MEWTVEDANVDDQFDVCYSLPSSSSPTCLGPLLDSTTLSTTVGSLEVGQEYTFIVTRYRGGMGTDSDPRVFTVEPCTAGRLTEKWWDKKGLDFWAGNGRKFL